MYVFVYVRCGVGFNLILDFQFWIFLFQIFAFCSKFWRGSIFMNSIKTKYYFPHITIYHHVLYTTLISHNIHSQAVIWNFKFENWRYIWILLEDVLKRAWKKYWKIEWELESERDFNERELKMNPGICRKTTQHNREMTSKQPVKRHSIIENRKRAQHENS